MMDRLTPLESKASETSADATKPHRTSNGVKIVAEGEEEGLQKLAEWCRKGTEWARVEDVKIERGEASGEFKHFEIG